MPLGSDPQDACPVVLLTDKGRIVKAEKDGTPKPAVRTFRVRFLTHQELRKANRLLDEARVAEREKREDESDAKLSELFKLALDGWENVTHRGEAMRFGEHDPVAFLTSFDVWDLATQCVIVPQVTEQELRFFASPSGQNGDAPAPAPATAGAATTPQAPTPPSASKTPPASRAAASPNGSKRARAATATATRS